MVDLLHAEQVNRGKSGQLGRRRLHYLATDTTGMFCLPSCGYGRRIAPAHGGELPNVVTASAAGFHPYRHRRRSER